ncbi:MAG: DinB family protein [Candidatus Dormibacteraceae bacterium]
MTGSNVEMLRIEDSWDRLVGLVNQVQDAGGLTRVGPDGWTVKDHLVHVAAWEHSLLALIEAEDRKSAMGLSEPQDGIEAVNEAIRKLHESDTADEALGYFRDAHSQLIAALAKLSDADLQKPYSHFQPTDPDEKRPVIAWVAGNTYEHYAEHIGWINQLINESSAAR